MKITDAEIKQILPSGFKLILDKEYLLPSDAEVAASVSRFISKRGEFHYEHESHDCDNAAVELLSWMSGKGWPFGLAGFPKHMVNVYINNKLELKYIEPQTGEFILPNARLKVVVMT